MPHPFPHFFAGLKNQQRLLFAVTKDGKPAFIRFDAAGCINPVGDGRVFIFGFVFRFHRRQNFKGADVHAEQMFPAFTGDDFVDIQLVIGEDIFILDFKLFVQEIIADTDSQDDQNAHDACVHDGGRHSGDGNDGNHAFQHRFSRVREFFDHFFVENFVHCLPPFCGDAFPLF